MKTRKMDGKGKKRIGMPCWFTAFLVNLVVALAAIAPFIIRDNGYFAMSHDFSAQEIPFNILMNDTVKSGNLLWNWAIDLGGNFMESFSFYNLGSVFVWLSFLFPSNVIPKVMGWMIIFKFAVAGGTSAAYLDRHLTQKKVIIISSMLYAFSGFQCTSIVFYHFLDVVALFPLMLQGLEILVEDGKRGRLIFACFLNVLCNYVFFVGEVCFLVIFYVVRYFIPEVSKIREVYYLRKKANIYRDCKSVGVKQCCGKILVPVFRCIFEGAIGMMIGGVLLIPAINGTLSNSRMSNHILGENWFSMSTAEWLSLLKALLVPGETMNNLSSIYQARWYSNAAYLPLFGILFVIAYILSKKDYITALMKAGLLIAAVPLLNSTFMFFSGEPYRRWYYMLILVMALATGKVLENPREYKIKKAAVITVCLYVFYIVMTAVIKWNNAGEGILFHKKQYFFGIIVAITGICLVLAGIAFLGKKAGWFLCAATAVCSCIVLMAVVKGYQESGDNSNVDIMNLENCYAENAVNYLTEIPAGLERDTLPYRYYFDEWIGYTYYNFAMTNMLPSVNSFISTAHPSVTKFYESLGNGRGTWTNAIAQGTRELLAVKYIVSVLEEPEYTFLEVLTNSNGQEMYLYENENALPIGFTYDTYMTASEYQTVLDMYRRPAGMLACLIVQDNDEEKVRDCLQHFSYERYEEINPDNVPAFVRERKQECSIDFTCGDNWFASRIIADTSKYAFFSVPYDKYWKAFVNGVEYEILDINGMMAVPIEEGINDIQFEYEYTPFKVGVACSVAGFVICGLYLGLDYRRRRRMVL